MTTIAGRCGSAASQPAYTCSARPVSDISLASIATTSAGARWKAPTSASRSAFCCMCAESRISATLLAPHSVLASKPRGAQFCSQRASRSDRARGEHGISRSAERWVPGSNGGQSLTEHEANTGSADLQSGGSQVANELKGEDEAFEHVLREAEYKGLAAAQRPCTRSTELGEPVMAALKREKRAAGGASACTSQPGLSSELLVRGEARGVPLEDVRERGTWITDQLVRLKALEGNVLWLDRGLKRRNLEHATDDDQHAQCHNPLRHHLPLAPHLRHHGYTAATAAAVVFAAAGALDPIPAGDGATPGLIAPQPRSEDQLTQVVPWRLPVQQHALLEWIRLGSAVRLSLWTALEGEGDAHYLTPRRPPPSSTSSTSPSSRSSPRQAAGCKGAPTARLDECTSRAWRRQLLGGLLDLPGKGVEVQGAGVQGCRGAGVQRCRGAGCRGMAGVQGSGSDAGALDLPTLIVGISEGGCAGTHRADGRGAVWPPLL
eukprot:scaffold95753_cov70-Phaeocystis_antarctica.AAC.8